MRPSVWAHGHRCWLFVLPQWSPAHAGPRIIISSKECTVFILFSPLPILFNSVAVSSLRGSIRLTNWEFQTPLFQPPLKHACRLCSGAMNPGILPDWWLQGPWAHRAPSCGPAAAGDCPRVRSVDLQGWNKMLQMQWIGHLFHQRKREKKGGEKRGKKFFSSNERCWDILVCW